MRTPDQKPARRTAPRRANAPALVLAIALTLTGVATFYVNLTTRSEDKLRFDSLVRETDASLGSSIENYISLLRGASGLLAAKPDVDRASFRDYVNRLGEAMHQPGIRGIGFTKRIPPGEERATIEMMHRQGLPKFAFWEVPHQPNVSNESSGPNNLRFATLFVEPEDSTNQGGLGFNMHSEPIRRTAMDAALESGDATATSRALPVRPKDPNRQPIILIYDPVYKGGDVPKTVEERRQKLIGFVYCPFRSDDLLRGVFKEPADRRFDVSVYDGLTTNPANLLHSSPKENVSNDTGFLDRTHLTVAGRTWTLVYKPGATFEATDIHLAPYVCFAGLIVSALLFSIARAQARAQLAADVNAGRLRVSDAARRASESRAQRLIESNIIGVVRAGFDGTIHEANDALLQLAGYSRSDIGAGGLSMDRLTAPEMAKRTERALVHLRRSGTHPPIESVLLRHDGDRIPIFLGATQLEGAEKDQFIAFILDISERKEAQKLVRENEIRQRAFLRDVLASVTEGKLRLCESPSDLPRCLDAIGEPITLSKPTLRVAREAARQAAQMLEMPNDRLQDLITAVGEGVMNAVAHAGGGTAYVGAEGHVVQVWIEDQGKGIDMGNLPRATLERGFTTAGSLGHGFFLMLKTIDRLWLLTGPDGTTVVIEQDVNTTEPNWLNSRPSVTQSANFDVSSA